MGLKKIHPEHHSSPQEIYSCRVATKVATVSRGFKDTKEGSNEIPQASFPG